MNLIMAGLDWHKAPIDLREQLSFTRNQVMELDRRLWKDPRIEGCALLSTCNRTELYLSCGDGADVDAGALLCAAAGADADAKNAPETRPARSAAPTLRGNRKWPSKRTKRRRRRA